MLASLISNLLLKLIFIRVNANILISQLSFPLLFLSKSFQFSEVSNPECFHICSTLSKNYNIATYVTKENKSNFSYRTWGFFTHDSLEIFDPEIFVNESLHRVRKHRLMSSHCWSFYSYIFVRIALLKTLIKSMKNTLKEFFFSIVVTFECVMLSKKICHWYFSRILRNLIFFFFRNLYHVFFLQ